MVRPPGLRQRSDSPTEPLAAMEKGLARWFKEQGIEVEEGE